MRVPFSYVFQTNADGTVSPRGSVHVNGITIKPGTSIGSKVSFGGFDISTAVGRDLEIEKNKDVVVIKDVYR